MKPYLFLLFAFLLTAIFSGCKKKESNASPCNGLINESPPVNISVQFVERSSGQNIILNDNIQTEDIKVTDIKSGKTLDNWRLIKEANAIKPGNGAVLFTIFNETPGKYFYEIKLKNNVAATLTYAVSKAINDDKCRPVVYRMSEIGISDRPFTQLSEGGSNLPAFLVVKI